MKFSATRTLQKNGVVERKNRTVQEMARIMLNDSKLDDKLWVQAIDIVVFIINRGFLRNNCKMNPYELWKGRPDNVKYFKIFGRKCYIKREDKKRASSIPMLMKVFSLVINANERLIYAKI